MRGPGGMGECSCIEYFSLTEGSSASVARFCVVQLTTAGNELEQKILVRKSSESTPLF